MELDTNSVGSGRKERINGGMMEELKEGFTGVRPGNRHYARHWGYNGLLTEGGGEHGPCPHEG